MLTTGKDFANAKGESLRVVDKVSMRMYEGDGDNCVSSVKNNVFILGPICCVGLDAY